MRREDIAIGHAAAEADDRGTDREGGDLSPTEQRLTGGDQTRHAYELAHSVAVKARSALNLTLSEGLPRIALLANGTVNPEASTAHGVVTRRINAFVQANAALDRAARHLLDCDDMGEADVEGIQFEVLL